MSGSATARYDDVENLPSLQGRDWVRACASEAVPDDEGVVVATIPPVSIFVSDGEFFCIDDTCTHEDYSLAEGWVQDCIVECTLHLAKFSLRTGAVLGPPASVPVATHPVVCVGEDLYIAIPTAYVSA